MPSAVIARQAWSPLAQRSFASCCRCSSRGGGGGGGGGGE